MSYITKTKYALLYENELIVADTTNQKVYWFKDRETAQAKADEMNELYDEVTDAGKPKQYSVVFFSSFKRARL